MVKMQTIELRISDHQILRVSVPAWEVPILEVIHNREPMVHIEDYLADRVVPDANDEFQRLATRYRNIVEEDGSKGIPFVAAVYGQFGVSKLERAIRDAIVTVPAASNADLLGEPVSSVGG
jgi:hypothetical protein